jgi:hypothetical protein
LERERLERERLERERLELERLEREQREREQRLKEQREREQREKEREMLLLQQQRERERFEKEQRERDERERLEREQRDRELREREQRDREQREKEKELLLLQQQRELDRLEREQREREEREREQREREERERELRRQQATQQVRVPLESSTTLIAGTQPSITSLAAVQRDPSDINNIRDVVREAVAPSSQLSITSLAPIQRESIETGNLRDIVREAIASSRPTGGLKPDSYREQATYIQQRPAVADQSDSSNLKSIMKEAIATASASAPRPTQIDSSVKQSLAAATAILTSTQPSVAVERPSIRDDLYQTPNRRPVQMPIEESETISTTTIIYQAQKLTETNEELYQPPRTSELNRESEETEIDHRLEVDVPDRYRPDNISQVSEQDRLQREQAGNYSAQLVYNAYKKVSLSPVSDEYKYLVDADLSVDPIALNQYANEYHMQYDRVEYIDKLFKFNKQLTKEQLESSKQLTLAEIIKNMNREKYELEQQERNNQLSGQDQSKLGTSQTPPPYSIGIHLLPKANPLETGNHVISRVDAGSIADTAGVRAMSKILKLNEIECEDKTHEFVLFYFNYLLRKNACHTIEMIVSEPVITKPLPSLTKFSNQPQPNVATATAAAATLLTLQDTSNDRVSVRPVANTSTVTTSSDNYHFKYSGVGDGQEGQLKAIIDEIIDINRLRGVSYAGLLSSVSNTATTANKFDSYKSPVAPAQADGEDTNLKLIVKEILANDVKNRDKQLASYMASTRPQTQSTTTSISATHVDYHTPSSISTLPTTSTTMPTKTPSSVEQNFPVLVSASSTASSDATTAVRGDQGDLNNLRQIVSEIIRTNKTISSVSGGSETTRITVSSGVQSSKPSGDTNNLTSIVMEIININRPNMLAFADQKTQINTQAQRPSLATQYQPHVNQFTQAYQENQHEIIVKLNDQPLDLDDDSDVYYVNNLKKVFKEAIDNDVRTTRSPGTFILSKLALDSNHVSSQQDHL